jgi:formate dehydrogenase major subunit
MDKIKVTINDIEITTSPGKTILEVINENKIDKIPTLCHDKRIEPFGSCFLCVVEVKGMKKLLPSCASPVSDGMVIYTNNERIKESRKRALELILSNHYADCIGPCKNNCPAGVDVQSYIALIAAEKYEEAIELIKEANPMALSICRVCVRDCEVMCRRENIDQPVAINALKRYVADIDNNTWVPEIKPKNNKKIAIVGGGPAGLTCAYYLAREGYSPTILERLPELGGMLRYGIPEYRLPKSTLDSEIKWITDIGVEVKTGVEMGKDFTVESLKKDGYDAIFLGVGAHAASKMRLDLEDETEGVIKGIDFLRELILKGIPKLDGTIAIVGGGNTAIDAARTAVRCGAKDVKILYRRSMKEMPAHQDEIDAAIEEGVDIMFLTLPNKIIREGNKLKAVECIKMELKEAKPGERARPVPIEGSEFTLELSYLVAAIGQAVDGGFLEHESDIKTESWGTIITNNETMATSIEGVFAGGDVVTGPFTAVTSISQGRKAAFAIMKYLTPDNIPAEKKFYSFKHTFGKLPESDFAEIPKIGRQKMMELPVTTRITNFEEVELGLSKEQAIEETERCLECGCSEYEDCSLRIYADEYQVDINNYLGDVNKYKVDNRHPFIRFDANKCINCGICVRTCSEILKVAALGFVHRGFKSVVKPAMEKELLHTNCVACGNCVDACPTGAIGEKLPFKLMGTLPKENFETVCNFCSIGCTLNYKKIDENLFYVSNSTESIKDAPNKGYACVKGRFGYRYMLNGNRLTEAKIKVDGKQQTVEVEKAIETASVKIKEIIDKYGNDSVAVFASPKMSNEELYLLQKFARTGLKNNNIESLSNLSSKVENSALDSMLGMTISSASSESIQTADVIVVMNSNLSEENLVMELKIKEAQKRGAKLVVINSSEIKLTKFADLWIDNQKGTSTVLMNGVLNQLINDALLNANFIEDKTTGFRELRNKIASYTPENVASFAKIDLSKFYEFYNLLKKQESKVVFVYNIDSTKEKSVNDLKSIANYLILTGKIEASDNGLLLLRDYANSTGLIDMGVNPNYLPGYIKHTDSEGIKAVENQWNTKLSEISNRMIW